MKIILWLLWPIICPVLIYQEKKFVKKLRKLQKEGIVDRYNYKEE